MTRDEAKAIVAALVTLRESATDEQALSVPVLYPAWREGVIYKVGERILYNGILYKVLTEHTSQADWLPDVSPPLFAKVLIPDSNIIPEWEQPDSTNGYSIGDVVMHNNSKWKSLVDNNVWEPTESVPTIWEKVEV